MAQKIRTGQITDSSEAWTSYSVTPTNFTIGTGGSASLTGSYKQVGKLVNFKILGILGTTSFSVGTSPTFSLPVTAASTNMNIPNNMSGDAFCNPGTSLYPLVVTLASTTTVGVLVINTTFTYPALVGITSSVPGTWAAGQYLQINGKYEAA